MDTEPIVTQRQPYEVSSRSARQASACFLQRASRAEGSAPPKFPEAAGRATTEKLVPDLNPAPDSNAQQNNFRFASYHAHYAVCSSAENVRGLNVEDPGVPWAEC